MTEQEYLQQIKLDGYRKADMSEAGFLDGYIDNEGIRVSTWITDSDEKLYHSKEI